MSRRTAIQCCVLVGLGLLHCLPRGMAQDQHAEEAKTESAITGSSDRSNSALNLLAPIKSELVKKWPKNRMVRIVFHGHSVPAGYFRAGQVRRYDSYPTLFHQALCQKYPNAVIDLSVTAIGGEHSANGVKRFRTDVLSLRPDLLMIDYGLNDRRIGLKAAKAAWQEMIDLAKEQNIPVVLLTPTPDSNENPLDPKSPLALHAAQVRELAEANEILLVDSFAAFGKRVQAGQALDSLLSQPNHPNRAGHEIVATLILKLFAP